MSYLFISIAPPFRDCIISNTLNLMKTSLENWYQGMRLKLTRCCYAAASTTLLLLFAEVGLIILVVVLD